MHLLTIFISIQQARLYIYHINQEYQFSRFLMKANLRLLSEISPLTVIVLEPKGLLLEVVHIHTESKEK